MHPRAQQLIRDLDLRPHPEGGWYRELFRSPTLVRAGDGAARAALTTILFLLVEGRVSRWHRVASDEVWHHLEGEPVRLHVFDGAGTPATHALGPGGDPAAVVPGGRWQAAECAGAYALAGCTVGPGFTFEDFALMADHPEAVAALRRAAPGLAGLVSG